MCQVRFHKKNTFLWPLQKKDKKRNSIQQKQQETNLHYKYNLREINDYYKHVFVKSKTMYVVWNAA